MLLMMLGAARANRDRPEFRSLALHTDTTVDTENTEQ
jgi:hypothetical protein